MLALWTLLVPWVSARVCEVVKTTVTCSGSGELTGDDVKSAGTYDRYEVAIVGKGITSIGSKAFMDCTRLVSITLPSTVTELGEKCFDGTSLRNITLPKGMTSIHPQAFNACMQLVGIHIEEGGGKYKEIDGMIVNKSLGLISVGAGRCAGDTLEIPNDVTSIGDSACRWNNAKSVIIPDSVEKIGQFAFYACESLESITIGSGVEVIHVNAFASSGKIATIKVSSKNKKLRLEAGIFGKYDSSGFTSICWIAKNVTNLEIPAKVTAICNTAIQSCPLLTKVTSKSSSFSVLGENSDLVVEKKTKDGRFAAGGMETITIPKEVTYLKTWCFKGCSKLREVKLHSGLKKIGSNIFRECVSLKSIDFAGCTMELSNGVATFTDYMCLKSSSLDTLVNWPTNNIAISEAAFRLCGFVNLELPNTVVGIGRRSFGENLLLESVSIPATVEYIDVQAFYKCGRLANVTFLYSGGSSNMKRLTSMVFAYCDSLEEITLPSTLTELIPSCFAFDFCLTKITFNRDSGTYRSDGSAVYKTNGNNPRHTFAICPPGLSSITTDAETQVIGYNSFYGCSKLYDVVIGNKVTQIEAGAFFECHLIESVRLPKMVNDIGVAAFDSCMNLKKILYCNNVGNIKHTGDPFPSDPDIYVFYDFAGDTFCGHPYKAILDHECNIPSDKFTSYHGSEQARPFKLFSFGRAMPAICYSSEFL